MNTTNYDWNLSDLYKDPGEWDKDFKVIEQTLKKLSDQKSTFKDTPESLFTFLEDEEQLSITLTRLYVYAKTKFDVNMKDQDNKRLFEQVDGLYHNYQDQLSFVEPELLKISPDEYSKYCRVFPELSKYDFMFEKLFAKKDHILDSETEQLLSGMDSLGAFFEKAYDDLTVSDIAYPKIKDPQTKEDVLVNNTNYYKALLHNDRSFRRDFFLNLLDTYKQHSNTITSLYYGSVKKNTTEARKRNYQSALDMALKSNFIEKGIYDNLVTTVRENNHVLQDYLTFRKESLHYDDLHFYDLFVPLATITEQSYTFEEAKEIIFKALSPLGTDYLEVIKKAFEEKWLDVFPKENKVSGAYAIGVYDVHPYSLLNFNGTLNDIFTIAHELGHVMHSYYSNQEQPYVNANYTIFCAEVASTVNEQLLYNYLLDHTENTAEKKYLLNSHLDSIRSTFFRQTLFAEFEKEVHEMVENHQPLTAAELSTLYHSLYEHYYGNDFVIDEALDYEWARIPHFYAAFYVYQYATGISAAIAISDKILSDPSYRIQDYHDFLKSGDSDYSVTLLKKAGADMRQPESIMATINNFNHTLQTLKNL